MVASVSFNKLLSRKTTFFFCAKFVLVVLRDNKQSWRMKTFLTLVVLSFCLTLLDLAHAECPNACSAHGRCGAYDMCICYRNWMAHDCSERVCQFDKGHIDSPKGDLDSSSGKLSGPSVNVVANDAIFPYGMTEQYPAMIDTKGNFMENTAHAFTECSNKGICDRASGVCGCFPGYEGSACQRATCPASAAGHCSGHGTCHSISEISSNDHSNAYYIWDDASTMGCVCDPGYKGADCSQRVCKAGVDPLYHGDYNTPRYSSFTYLVHSSHAAFTSSTLAGLTGNYSLTFYDWHGNAWYTEPIDADASCLDVISALEALPKGTIPLGSVRCSTAFYLPSVPAFDTLFNVLLSYTLVFTGNPGKLKALDLNIQLDGDRPTLFATKDTMTSSLGYVVFPNGYAGEDTDYVPDLCTGVLVTIASNKIVFSSGTALALMKCLADADGLSSNNVGDGYSWDTGFASSGIHLFYTNPHLIKLVDATQDLTESRTGRNLESVTTPGLNNQLPSLFFDQYSRVNASNYLGGIPTFYEATYTTGNIIKSPAITSSNADPPGFFAVVVYDDNIDHDDSSRFNIITNVNSFVSTVKYHVYTTSGYLQLVSPASNAVTMTRSAYGTPAGAVTYFSNTVLLSPNTISSDYYGQIDCESLAQSPNYPHSLGYSGAHGSLDCLQKGDMVMLLNTDTTTSLAAMGAANPSYPDIYTISKVSITPFTVAETTHNLEAQVSRQQLVLDYGVNQIYGFDAANDYSAYTSGFSAGTGGAAIYKFYPPTGFTYVGECSNRGLCDTVQGTCTCFAGYTGDNCGRQNSLAL